MNLLEFIVATSLLVVALSWFASYGPEIFQEKMVAWKTSHPNPIEEVDSELTVEMEVGSFDPETTVTLPKVEQNELQVVFVISKQPARNSHRRHART
jgi:hypothetical protein